MALIAGGGSPGIFALFGKNFGETGYQRNARAQARVLITGPKGAKTKTTPRSSRGDRIPALQNPLKNRLIFL